MSWLKDHSDAIQSAAAIVGVVVAIVGFGLTIWQLVDTNAALRASNTYDIQRDARDLVDDIQENGLVQQFANGTLAEDKKEKAMFDVWRMYNFYLGVFRQVQAGGVSEGFAQSFGEDFCQRVRHPKFDEAWEEMAEQKRISAAHVKMREVWCAGY